MKTGDNMKEHPLRLELRERSLILLCNLLLPTVSKVLRWMTLRQHWASPNVLYMKSLLIKKPY